MYEFVAKVGEDILKTMSLNWQQVCRAVQPSIDGEITLNEEKQVLAKVTKIYIIGSHPLCQSHSLK